MPQHAVIYTRVSSQKQVVQGHGLASQETRAREFARMKGYDIREVFRDEGLSGKLMHRPNMQAMIKYVAKHKKDNPVIIIDDISRLARDVETHILLRTAIQKAGGKLESPSIEFGDDSDSRLVELLLASVSAHQREKNAEQVSNRMRSRMQAGYAVFNAPPGYIYGRRSGHGKILVRDEPCASAITEALEGFASGRFSSQSEVKRFLEKSPDFPAKRVYYQRVKDILTQVLYAGYLERPSWGIHMLKGHHEPLISYDTWQRIQNRLQEECKAPARADINDDFPMRGFVACNSCGNPMTGCWSKGRTGMYAYYLCRHKGCEMNGKSIRKEKLEADFEALLSDMRPSDEIFTLAKSVFNDAWEAQSDIIKQGAETIRKEIMALEKKSEIVMDRIIESDNEETILMYEKRMQKISEDKVALDEKIAQCGRPLQSFDETFQTAIGFLRNPQKLWHSGSLEHKRTLLKLGFSDTLKYCRKEGFQTAEKAYPFWLTGQFCEGKYDMVEGTGFEPVYAYAGRFTVCCL
jgi:site-specific DNA recombinase